MTRKYSLRWIDFHKHLNQSLEAFLDAEDLVDVTLEAEGQSFRAHKLVLSICSPLFKDLFKSNPCEHPTVVLKNIECLEVEKLLQFIYRGEVHVTEQELNPFLETAEFLQIKGLASVRSQSQLSTVEPHGNQQTNVVKVSTNNRSKCDSSEKDNSDATEASIDYAELTIKENIDDSLDHDSSKTNNNALSDCNSLDNENNRGTKVTVSVSNECASATNDRNSNPESKPTSVKCKQCHRFFANSYNLKVHIKDKHDTEEGTLRCHKCHKRMRNPSCLRVHLYQHHRQVFSFGI